MKNNNICMEEIAKLAMTTNIQNEISQAVGSKFFFCWKVGSLEITLSVFSGCTSVPFFNAGPRKLENLSFLTHFFIFSSITKKLKNWNFPSTPLKSWLKNLSNEYIYVEQNLNRTRDIGVQSWPFRSRDQ